MFICCECKKKKKRKTFCLKLPLWHRLAQPLAECSRECFNRIKPRSVHQRKNGIKRTIPFPGAFLSVWVYGWVCAFGQTHGLLIPAAAAAEHVRVVSRIGENTAFHHEEPAPSTTTTTTTKCSFARCIIYPVT